MRIHIISKETKLTELLVKQFIGYSITVSENLQGTPNVIINLHGISGDVGTPGNLINPLVELNIITSVNLIAKNLQSLIDNGGCKIIWVNHIPEGGNLLQDRLYESCRAFIEKFIMDFSLETEGTGVTINSISLSSYPGSMVWETGEMKFGTALELHKALMYFIESSATGEMIELKTTPSCS